MRRLRHWLRQQLERPIPPRQLAHPDQGSGQLKTYPVRSAETINWGNPVDFAGKPVNLIDAPPTTLPGSDIYQLQNAKIVPTDGWIYTQAGKLVSEASWYKGYVHEMRRQAHLPRRKIHLAGQTLTLASDYANNNYGHFLLDVVGRLALVRESGSITPEQFDHVVINGPKTAWKVRLLNRFGIQAAQCVWLDRQSIYAEQLTATSFPALRRTYIPQTVAFLRSALPQEQHSCERRLFIVRKGDGRALVNQAELLEIATAFGFEAYQPENSSDSINDFAHAQAVIGVHGAGLADIAFMQPGKHVLELMPSDHRFGYFYTLGKSAELDYHIIVGNTICAPSTPISGPTNQPLSIDADLFERYLQQNF